MGAGHVGHNPHIEEAQEAKAKARGIGDKPHGPQTANQPRMASEMGTGQRPQQSDVKQGQAPRIRGRICEAQGSKTHH